MTPLKTIAGKVERDKHPAEGAKRIKENYARFKPKVVRDGINSIQRGLHDRDGKIPGQIF